MLMENSFQLSIGESRCGSMACSSFIRMAPGSYTYITLTAAQSMKIPESNKAYTG